MPCGVHSPVAERTHPPRPVSRSRTRPVRDPKCLACGVLRAIRRLRADFAPGVHELLSGAAHPRGHVRVAARRIARRPLGSRPLGAIAEEGGRGVLNAHIAAARKSAAARAAVHGPTALACRRALGSRIGAGRRPSWSPKLWRALKPARCASGRTWLAT